MFLKNPNNTTKIVNTKPAINQPSKKSVPSIISADMSILGNIVVEGMVDFDGKLDGNIKCQSIVVRHNSIINGEIIADNIQVYGKIKGLLKGKSVQLNASCTVEGIIMHEKISIEDGALIDGKFKRMDRVDHSDDDDDDELEFEGNTSSNVLEGLKLIGTS